MSVRDAMLAILSLGPVYGLQLHAEFTARTPHRKRLNVGQVYSTLDRAATIGLVEPAGETSDGLPLSRLTTLGLAHARGWMSAPVDGSPTWEEMLDQVLVTATIAPDRIGRLADRYRRAWAGSVVEGDDAVSRARRALAGAAAGWLTSVEPELRERDALPLSLVRPRRGRRPGTAA